MNGFTIQVTDEHWRPLDADTIRWELDGLRKVVVSARFAGDQHFRSPDTRPQVKVLICEHDEFASPFAVIEMPENGGFGGLRAEHAAALTEVLQRAREIADEANELIRAARDEYEADRLASAALPENIRRAGEISREAGLAASGNWD